MHQTLTIIPSLSEMSEIQGSDVLVANKMALRAESLK